jgi:hypothetical protein
LSVRRLASLDARLEYKVARKYLPSCEKFALAG